MESLSSQFFCHSCKKLFHHSPPSSLADADDDVVCTFCSDPFVEQIEDQEQLKALKELYKIAEEEEEGEQFYDCSSDHPDEERKEEVKNDQPVQTMSEIN